MPRKRRLLARGRFGSTSAASVSPVADLHGSRPRPLDRASGAPWLKRRHRTNLLSESGKLHVRVPSVAVNLVFVRGQPLFPWNQPKLTGGWPRNLFRAGRGGVGLPGGSSPRTSCPFGGRGLVALSVTLAHLGQQTRRISGPGQWHRMALINVLLGHLISFPSTTRNQHEWAHPISRLPMGTNIMPKKKPQRKRCKPQTGPLRERRHLQFPSS